PAAHPAADSAACRARRAPGAAHPASLPLEHARTCDGAIPPAAWSAPTLRDGTIPHAPRVPSVPPGSSAPSAPIPRRGDGAVPHVPHDLCAPNALAPHDGGALPALGVPSAPFLGDDESLSSVVFLSSYKDISFTNIMIHLFIGNVKTRRKA